MDITDDDLTLFAASGTTPLPAGGAVLDHDGARIWFARYGDGDPVVLLHGGMGNSGNWGYQVPQLVAAGRSVIVVDTRGHGRSSRDDRPLDYRLFADDVAAVLAELGVQGVPVVGWSDGAVTALELARRTPAAVASVLFFACNVQPEGAKEFVFTDTVGRCLERHRLDFAALSPQPDAFERLAADLGVMQSTLPDYSDADLAAISVPVTVVHAEHDEFIRESHARHIAATVQHGRFVPLAEVSHFAPVQRPPMFGDTILDFLDSSGE